MSLLEKLSEDVKNAMRAKDVVALTTLRMVRAQIKDSQIAKGEELSEAEVLGILLNAGKKRKEAIELYEKGGRNDLVEQEKAELEVISRYLPAQLSRDEIVKIVDEVVKTVGATSAQDLGKVMGAAMTQLKGKADGRLIQEVVREKLG